MAGNLNVIIVSMFNTAILVLYVRLFSIKQLSSIECRNKIFIMIMALVTSLTWFMTLLWIRSGPFYRLVYIGFLAMCLLVNWSILSFAFIRTPELCQVFLGKCVKLIPSENIQARCKRNLTVSTVKTILWVQLLSCILIWIGISVMSLIFAWTV